MPTPSPRTSLPGASPCLLLASGRVLETHAFTSPPPEASPPPLSPVPSTTVEIAGARRRATAANDDKKASHLVCSTRSRHLLRIPKSIEAEEHRRRRQLQPLHRRSRHEFSSIPATTEQLRPRHHLRRVQGELTVHPSHFFVSLLLP